jgi:hypothetical protein
MLAFCQIDYLLLEYAGIKNAIIVLFAYGLLLIIYKPVPSSSLSILKDVGGISYSDGTQYEDSRVVDLF